jgi:hypothetical protein
MPIHPMPLEKIEIQCCLKYPLETLPEVPSKNFGRRALVQVGRSPRTRYSTRFLGCVFGDLCHDRTAACSQPPPCVRGCNSANKNRSALVTAQLIGLHADCLFPVCCPTPAEQALAPCPENCIKPAKYMESKSCMNR